MSFSRRLLVARAVRAAGIVAFTTSFAAAQTVWRVDGIRYSDVASAYAVAQPGDVILVTLPDAPLGNLGGKGVRIVAGSPALRLNATNAQVSGIPAGQQLVLSGFTLDCSFLFFSFPLDFVDCRGSLVLENCTGYADPNSYGLKTLEFRRCDDVQLFGCVWQGESAGRFGQTACTSSFGYGSPGLRLEDSRATIVGCGFGGGDSAACPWWCVCNPPSGSGSFAGASGINARRSRLSVHECTLRGGRGSSSTGIPAPDGGAVAVSASELWISPTPVASLSGDAASIVNVFGAAPSIVGTPSLVHVTTALPALQAILVSNVLRLSSTWSVPRAPCYFGASLRSSFVPLGSFGHLGLLEMDYATSQSLLLGTGIFDAAGVVRAQLPIPPQTILNLRYQDFRLQLLTLDGSGRIAVSGVDFLMFPG